jgi:hypothetical protein
MTVNWHEILHSMIHTVALAYLVTFASSLSDPLADSSSIASASKQELRNTIQSYIFNIGHNGMSNSMPARVSKTTSVMTGQDQQIDYYHWRCHCHKQASCKVCDCQCSWSLESDADRYRTTIDQI